MKLPPITPGDVLFEEFLAPLEISQTQLAREIGVPPNRINQIINGKREITADTALRLSRFFGLSDRFWLNLQMRFELELEKDRLGSLVETQVEVFAKAG